MLPLVFLLALVAQASACSLAAAEGISVTDIQPFAGDIRLQLSKHKGGDLKATKQVIYNTTTNVITPYEDNVEFGPHVTGFESHPPAVVTPGNLTVLVESVGNVTLPLNTTNAVWWYSSSLMRIFAVYYPASLNFSSSEQPYKLAICTVDGQCNHVAAPEYMGYVDGTQGTSVWDGQGLVALPLMCCVCLSFEYYTFSLTGITRIAPLNTLGPSYFGDGYAWISDGGQTGYSDLLIIQKYFYATHTSTRITLSTKELKDIFGDDLPGWGIVLIVVGSLLAVILFAFAVKRCRVKKVNEQQEGKAKLGDHNSSAVA